MMMRCRLFVMGAAVVFGLCLADVARAGSGHVPAPQAMSGPIATAQGPSPQGEWAGGCDTCGPVVYESCGGRQRLGGCLDGLKCKLGGMGNGLKCGLHDMGCGVRDGLHGLKCKLGGIKLCHKKSACEPVCYPAPCAPCGEVVPSAQGYPSHQGHPGGTPQAPTK
jgi:hypothetical protein